MFLCQYFNLGFKPVCRQSLKDLEYFKKVDQHMKYILCDLNNLSRF